MKKSKQQNLPKYKEIYYRVMVLICKFHSCPYPGITLPLFATLIMYLFMFFAVPLMLGYDPLSVPVILRILVLAICLVFFFFIGNVIDRAIINIQKHFEFKLKSIKKQ